MKTRMRFMALGVVAALALAACGTDADSGSGATDAAGSTEIKLWLVGGDTPDELRTYLKTTFEKENKGYTLKIEEQAWEGLVTKMTSAMADAGSTPDVAEIGNTQSPTLTVPGYFLDISKEYSDLGGEKLLESFVAAGTVDDAQYTLPYYFGSRYMFYRKDVWSEAGVALPTTLAEFNTAVASIAASNPRQIADFSGMFLGGQDWRNGVSWVFANGGDLAKKDGDEWASTLSDPKTIEGMKQFQAIQTAASKAPKDGKDVSPWLYINDADSILDADGKETGKTSLAAATIMAPGWAHWSIGDATTNDKGEPAREWNSEVFGTLALPGNDGKPAPVFAGGSNIGVAAKSKNPEQAKALMKIIFSEEYQTMLGKNGLGPGNQDYVSSLGDDEFAKAMIESASNSKLTPAAVGWGDVEDAKLLEEFFGKVAQGGDIDALAKEYDAKIDALING